MKTSRYKKIVNGIMLLPLLIATTLVVYPQTTSAQYTPYGGRSQAADFCSCSFCWKVDVGDPNSGEDLMYCPLITGAYNYYNVYPDAWQLLIAGDYMTCLQISYPSCEEDGGGPLMILHGSSMY